MAAKQERDKIEYEFEDLRRNSDPVPNLVLAQLGIEEEEDAERQEGKKRKESARKDDDEDDDRDDRDDDLDDDDEVTLTRKELAREITAARQEAERKARKEIRAAKDEAGAEIGKLRKRIDGIERKGKGDEIESEFEPQIKELEAQIEAAMEAGESSKVIQLNKQLAELVAERKVKLLQQKQESTKDDDTEGTKPTTIPRAQEWLDEQDWFDDPEFGYVRAYLNKLDGVLQKKGYRPTEDDYYEQLERKLEKQFPGVITRTMRVDDDDEDEDEDDDDDDRDRDRGSRRSTRDRDDDDDDGRDGFDDIESKREARARARRRQREAGRRHSPVGDDRGGVDRERAKRRERDSDTVTLTRAQIANMRAFQLDPDNPKHVEEYMLEAKRNRRESRR